MRRSAVHRIRQASLFAGLRVTEPPLNATLRPADPSDRAVRTLARFLIAAFLGVAGQSYGEAAKQMIARWAA
jgi:hypothetical protein